MSNLCTDYSIASSQGSGSRAPVDFLYRETEMKIGSDHVALTRVDVVIFNDQLIRKCVEQAAKIRELKAELNSKRIFESNDLDLPEDYYENDAYLDD